MTAGLRALMTGVIDYAGLFPPAKLPLQEAVREYLTVRESPEAWMLGAFVIPAARVSELGEWKEDVFRADRPFELSLLGRSAETVRDWHSQLETDVASVNTFRQEYGPAVAVSSWEVPLPPEPLSTATGSVATVFQAAEPGVDRIFLEIPPGPAADESRRRLISEISSQDPRDALSFKLRTGGLKPDAFPSVEQLAAIIGTCQQYRCRWKATAGLHHPLRHHDSKIGVMMHGFLNVLFAAVLADAHDLPESTLREIIADEHAGDFQISDDGIRWRDYSATVADIEATRQTTFQSFGSCSFGEPRDDLKALGHL